MKCQSFYRYNKQILQNKKNYPPIYQKSLKVINQPTDRPTDWKPLEMTQTELFCEHSLRQTKLESKT